MIGKPGLYTYVAYGLRIAAALPLPELTTAESGPEKCQPEADVVVRFGKVAGCSGRTRGAHRSLCATDTGMLLTWEGVGAFLVRDGCEIIVDPDPGVEEHVLRLFILGTTFAVLLHQRKEVTVLHASVVAIAGQAIAFAGAKGMGKSTMAAALQARGHDLVADDILAVKMQGDQPVALPGFPHLKLWPDSLASLGYGAERLPRLRPEVEKRGYRLNAGFTPMPVPLRCIYLLSSGP